MIRKGLSEQLPRMLDRTTIFLLLVVAILIPIAGFFALGFDALIPIVSIVIALGLVVVVSLYLKDSTEKLGNYTSELVKATEHLTRVQIAPQLDWNEFQQPSQTHEYLRFCVINKGADLAEIKQYSAKLEWGTPLEIRPFPRDRGLIVKRDESICFDITEISESETHYQHGTFVNLRIDYVDKEKNGYPALERKIKVE